MGSLWQMTNFLGGSISLKSNSQSKIWKLNNQVSICALTLDLIMTYLHTGHYYMNSILF